MLLAQPSRIACNSLLIFSLSYCCLTCSHLTAVMIFFLCELLFLENEFLISQRSMKCHGKFKVVFKYFMMKNILISLEFEGKRSTVELLLFVIMLCLKHDFNFLKAVSQFSFFLLLLLPAVMQNILI